MIQLWTISNLQRLDFSIRKKIMFYAPLTESLDFFGVDPITYTWTGTTTATLRGGARTIIAPAAIFNFQGEVPYGLFVNTPTVQLGFNVLNNLNNANTVIWFENRVPKSSPTNGTPFDINGFWIGGVSIYVSHIVKADSVLANSEINKIQAALLDVPPQVIPPPSPPVSNIGTFMQETPSGTINSINTTFTLSQNPDLNSLLVFAFGAGALKRVTSGPGNLEFTAGGTGNRTITMGLAPAAGSPFFAQYVVGP